MEKSKRKSFPDNIDIKQVTVYILSQAWSIGKGKPCLQPCEE